MAHGAWSLGDAWQKGAQVLLLGGVGERAATPDSQMFLICVNWGTKQVLVKTHLQAFRAELFNFYSKKVVPGSGSQELRGRTAVSRVLPFQLLGA